MSDDIKSGSFEASELLADEALLRGVYPELNRLARRFIKREGPYQTLQPTILTNEVYLQLANSSLGRFENRAHFYAVAAKVMRQILVDHARRKMSEKRGGAELYFSLDEVQTVSDPDFVAVEIGEALSLLEKFDSQAAKITEMRFFAGMTDLEIAEVLGISVVTVNRDWRYAKAWLYNLLTRRAESAHSGQSEK